MSAYSDRARERLLIDKRKKRFKGNDFRGNFCHRHLSLVNSTIADLEDLHGDPVVSDLVKHLHLSFDYRNKRQILVIGIRDCRFAQMLNYGCIGICLVEATIQWWGWKREKRLKFCELSAPLNWLVHKGLINPRISTLKNLNCQLIIEPVHYLPLSFHHRKESEIFVSLGNCKLSKMFNVSLIGMYYAVASKKWWAWESHGNSRQKDREEDEEDQALGFHIREVEI
ncbi:hypothetical protein AMTR_s00055p00164630 [Amborella trichopoda]|uniref:Uncharacterized protein n=1 Tax=Amborella trichopoda TaxID=13333 RepID=U5D750_AMBTC|nr:hypothetical protein AMTR_s00055p00164630 [Amborella trichopoda]